MQHITYQNDKDLPRDQVLSLYRALDWSSANKPDLLMQALNNSHRVVTAWDGDRLVGLGNTLSDGFLVVYYSHLCVHPAYQGMGIGRTITQRLQNQYADFHQHVVMSDGDAIGFYEKFGFTEPSHCTGLWIYQGDDHN